MKTSKGLKCSTSIFRFLLLVLLIALANNNIFSQDMELNLGVSSRYFTYSRGLEWNAELKSKYSLQRFTLQTGFGFDLLPNQNTGFSSITTTRSYSMELRYYPFVKAKLGSGCQQSNFYERLPSLGTKLAYGLYVAPGFQYNTNKILVSPDPTLESPISKINAWVRESNLTLFLGYQAKFNFLSIGLGYGVSIGKVALQDDFNILKEDQLFTSTFPVDYRLQFNPRFSLGVNF